MAAARAPLGLGRRARNLQDGAMAIFADCEPALESAFEAIAQVAHIQIDGYRPLLRAGLHVGRPYRIGQDYVGVDVNVAARLCEAAPASGVLVSGKVQEHLEERWPLAPARDIRLRGVPAEVSIHFARPRACAAERTGQAPGS